MLDFSGPSGLLEVMRNRFQSIVDEMGSVLLRTGHTVFVRETGDFSCALVTPRGEVFSAPTRIGMTRIVGMNMEVAIQASQPMADGDIWIGNDPLSTGGMSTHLPDIFLWKPIYVDGTLLCFALGFIHVSDIGGRVPGSISPTSREIFEEGLILPPSRLYSAGELNRELLRIIQANSRTPEQVWGDLKAAVAALMVAERAVKETAKRYGVGTVAKAAESLLQWADNRARDLFRGVPNGEYEFVDYMEGVEGLQDPFPIKLSLGFRDGKVTMDFTGTHEQVACAYNIPTGGKGPHYYLTTGLVTFLRSLDPHVPYNSGLVRSVETILPTGSILNPDPGAAIGVRAATMHRIYDVVMGCMATAMREVIPAAGAGQGPVLVVSVAGEEPGETKVSVVQPLRGGSGGRPMVDGVDGNDFTVGSGRNIPTEVLEQEMPLLIHRYGLRAGSAGAGKFRGGVGLELEFELLAPSAIVTCRGLERYRFRPWGRLGGMPGELGQTLRNKSSPDEMDLGRIDTLSMLRHERLYFATPGGGGYGDPLQRDPEAVLQDVMRQLITVEQAAEDYGVVIANNKVDEKGTATLRAYSSQRSNSRPNLFAFGAERQAMERGKE